jgi:hypothetical protein
MRATKGERREKKRQKKRHGMRIYGKSVMLLAGLNTTGKRKKQRRKRRK